MGLWEKLFEPMDIKNNQHATYDFTVDTKSLYIHWPFCPYKCHFCPFVALVGHDQYMPAYHQALCQEIQNFMDNYQGDKHLESIFIGGGTPSTYPLDLLLELFELLKKKFIIGPETEIVIEVNPGTVTPDHLVAWRQAGINRVSIGVQTIKSDVLKNFNRLHDQTDVYRLLGQVTSVTENISVDLILGLPGVSPCDWKNLINEVVTWPIKHVSIYLLTIHEGTPLFFDVRRKRVSLASDDLIADLYSWTVEFLATHGIYRYEVSNFAKPGYASLHNKIYWQRKSYRGFGIGACSFDGHSRYRNQIVLQKYLDGIQNGQSITNFSETLSVDDARLEKVMLGLRQADGLSIAELFAEQSVMQQVAGLELLKLLEQEQLLTINHDRCLLTSKGLLVENEIVVRVTNI